MIRLIALLPMTSAALVSFTNGGPGFSPATASPADQFDAAWQRLKQGPTYTTQKTGAFQIRYPFSASVEFENWIDVPAGYDPSRPWPLRVQLHGGVSRPAPNALPPGQQKPTTLAPNRIAGESQIYVHPSGWNDAPWWDASQVDNILRLLRDLKERYNVDESRTGNGFAAKTRGVKQFTLLLSPDVVDFGQPVTVSGNGKAIVNAPVKADIAVLEKWASRDRDRTMLDGTELQVLVP